MIETFEQHTRFRATYQPRKTDSLEPGAEAWIGRDMRWERAGRIEEGDHAGEWACYSQGFTPPIVWVPSGDLADAYQGLDPDHPEHEHQKLKLLQELRNLRVKFERFPLWIKHAREDVIRAPEDQQADLEREKVGGILQALDLLASRVVVLLHAEGKDFGVFEHKQTFDRQGPLPLGLPQAQDLRLHPERLVDPDVPPAEIDRIHVPFVEAIDGAIDAVLRKSDAPVAV